MEKELIIWSEEYAIDNYIIDHQHKILIGHINSLYNAFLQGKATEILHDLTNKLYEYTIFHFNVEERFFEQANYPDKEKHTEEHLIFIEKAVYFKQKLEANEAGLAYEMMYFLRDWLQNHILSSDKQYIKYLRKEYFS